MAEIKSAIELAMEKTKSLGMDEKERELFARKDIENKVRVILRRYQEDMIDDHGVQKELNNIDGDESLKAKVLCDALIEGFDVTGDNKRIFALFHLTGCGLDERLGVELEALQENFTREMEKRRMIVAARIGDKLKTAGITGSSIEPNIEEWDEWKETLDEVARAFSERVDEWKKRLAEAMNKGSE
ncbi:MAG: hypothetical protein A4E64_01117 [Syntrophorhabdus sp. PtaU1.Bin058]|nr:MAG: hypothetical protein A4E64_01117 [Syntrophorhabdus sp. PtaU1.Bin058]